MSARIALEHRTQYRYDRAVSLSPQEIRLRPAAHACGGLEAYSLIVGPRHHTLKWLHDAYGNRVARITFDKPVREFTIDVKLVAHMGPVNPFDFAVDERALQFPFSYDEDERRALASKLLPRVPNFSTLEDVPDSLTVDFADICTPPALHASMIVDAVRAYATEGEIIETLRQVFGSYREPASF